MEQLTFASDEVEAVVLPEIGARLHRLRVSGHDLLRTPDDVSAHEREPFFWGSYVMAPWCNRIDGGPMRVGSRQVALGSNFPDGSAIHGQVYARAWEVRDDGTLATRAGGNGWPWEYEVVQRVEAAERVLRIDLAITNHSTDPMPAGLGIHPWFRQPVLVAIRGDAVFEPNTATPARPEPVRGPLDLRRLGEMPPGLDATWADLGVPPVELGWPDLGIRATMEVTAPSVYIVAASPPDLDAVAVEPETHAPQGMRRLINGEPGPLASVQPGASLSLSVTLAFEPWAAGQGWLRR